jgi:hypothetical protein
MHSLNPTNTWELNIRDYDPSEPPTHLNFVNEFAGIHIEGKEITTHQSFLKFASKMTKKLLLSGFNVLNLTLPAVMLTNKSSAELMLYGFGGLSLYTSEAVKKADPVDKMKLVQAGLVSTLTHVVRVMEGNPPFPNLLGGTLVAEYPNGITAYVEQAGENNTDNRILICGSGFRIHTYCLVRI